MSGHLLYPGHLLKKKGRTLYFARFITMSSTLLRTAGLSVGFFHKNLREGTLELIQKEPEVQRNPLPNHKENGVMAVVIHGNPAEEKELEGSFHLNTVRIL